MPDGPQNIYDDPAFFAGYSQMDRFQGGWGRAMEHNLLTSMLGDVAGLRVLDLGCGGGQLAYHLAEAGAAAVTAIDASERMLDVARTQWAHQRVTYLRQTMEEASFAAGAFDAVVSSLAFHYVADYAGLVGRIGRWLVPGGRLAFSTEHPVYAARASEEGWVVEDGRNIAWAIDRYGVEGLRERRWFVEGVRRYHRTFATLINGLIAAGFRVDEVAEPVPDASWVSAHPQDADEPRRPMFLLVSATTA